MECHQTFKIVITDCDHGDIEIEKEVLKEIPAEIILGECKTEHDVLAIASDAHGIINQYVPLSGRVIEKLEKCLVIARYGVGVDNIELQSATRHGIIVSNVPGYCVEEVSIHTLALLFCLVRKICFLNKEVKQGEWDFRKARPIYRVKGKILGIVGLGEIGRCVARKAQGLGLKVIGYDPYIKEAPEGVRRLGFEELLATADYISIHIPLTSETKNLFKESTFRQMKRGALLINTSRGGVVDEAALYKALKKGWISGAALDVMSPEPPSLSNPLLECEEVILTPHISFYSEDSLSELKKKTALNVLKVLQGDFPLSIVNKEVLGCRKKI